MPIPAFREDGWLPEGHWPATWDEITQVFGGNPGSRRGTLMARLLAWRDAVRVAGISGRLILDGSFASTKIAPDDLDALLVFDATSVTMLEQNPAARDLLDHRQIKESGLGDIFVFGEPTVREFPAWCRLDLFDYDTRSGVSKGVVEVDL